MKDRIRKTFQFTLEDDTRLKAISKRMSELFGHSLSEKAILAMIIKEKYDNLLIQMKEQDEMDKIIWKDGSSYSQSDKARIPTIWNTEIECVEITVHRYVGCGDIWFLSCRELALDMRELGNIDIDEAKKKAVKIIYAVLGERIEKYERIRKVIESEV